MVQSYASDLATMFNDTRFLLYRTTSQVSLICACLGLFFPGVLSARADLVMLTSGERMMGKVLPKSNDEILVLQSTLLGEISLPRSSVLRIEASPAAEIGSNTPKHKRAPQSEGTPQEVTFTGTSAKQEGAQITPKQLSDRAEKAAKIIEFVDEETGIYERFLGFNAPDSWQGNLRVGMNISRGDKQWTETALRGKLEIAEKGSRNFYRLAGAYTYRETEKNNGDTFKSTDRYDGTFTYRRSFQQNWFFQNALGARVDQVKGIDLELQDTIGIGYKYKPTKKFELLVGGGGGVEDYQTTFDDTRAGVSQVLNVFQEFTWRPFSRTSVIQKFNYYWNPEATEQYNYVLTAAVRLRLTDLLGFEFSYNQKFDNDIGNGNPKDDAIWRNALVIYF